MENEGTLAGYVEELLGMHNCITIAGLGSFIYRDSAASANVFSMEIKPSGKTIFFNNAITADDGILVNKIRESRGISYNQALDFVNAEASEIRSGLSKNKSMVFGNLGNFFLNAEGQSFFLPTANLNLSHESYGLPVLKLSEFEEKKNSGQTEKVEEVKMKPIPVEETQDYDEADVLHVMDTQPSKMKGILFRAAAIFVVVTLAAAGIYFSSDFIQHSKTPQSQANVVSPAKPATDLAEEVLTETTEFNQNSVIAEEETTNSDQPENQEVNAMTLVSVQDLLNTLKKTKGTYFVLGGMYMDEQLAIAECEHWNKNQVSATYMKPEGSSLYKVILARFANEKTASEFTGKLPEFNGANVSVRQVNLMK